MAKTYRNNGKGETINANGKKTSKKKKKQAVHSDTVKAAKTEEAVVQVQAKNATADPVAKTGEKEKKAKKTKAKVIEVKGKKKGLNGKEKGRIASTVPPPAAVEIVA